MLWFGAAILAVWTWNVVPSIAGGDPQKGKPIYEKHCLLCHGPQGIGDGPQGQLMDPPAPNFRDPGSKIKSDEELMKAIREGHPDSAMTKWAGILSEEDMDHVLSYIRKLSRGPDKGL
jgi:mono/diheme cytochrome c family protein